MNKKEITQKLQSIQNELSQVVEALSSADFENSEGESWSAKGYLEHLILSVKPFVKGLGLPKDKLAAMFGESQGSPKAYEAVVEMYKGRLAEGIRAEDYDKVTPDFYRFPEGTEDEKAFLLNTWNETHEKLYSTLETWEESDLDRVQIPHPAIGAISMREMLYFTIFHNGLHLNDIKNLHLKQEHP